MEMDSALQDKVVNKYIWFFLIASSLLSCKKEPSSTIATIPSVSTTSVSSITSTSAISGGSIIYEGDASITAKGVCYSTVANPTLSNNIVSAGIGSASFTCNLTGLTPNTTYYLRAYATNSAGTAYGNNQIIFNTLLNTPILTTISASSITGNVAVSGGNVTDNGGATVLTRGVCFGVNPNPTINDSVSLSLSGTDSFTVNLNGLTDSTTYYVRAFATTTVGTGYGNEISFTTLEQLIAIGESYNGGIIFYINDHGDEGYVVAPNDQSTSADWGCAGIAITGADGIGVGNGPQNSIDIMNECGTTGTAVAICSNLVLDGYSDWFLPSKGELEVLYQNLYLSGFGNFSQNSYWSSSEVDGSNAWSFNFNTNTAGNANKFSPYMVRAIRSVTFHPH